VSLIYGKQKLARILLFFAQLFRLLRISSSSPTK